jgi:hypothetical protein
MKAEDAEKILGREAIHLDGGFRLDFFVADSVVVEVQSHRRPAPHSPSSITQLSQTRRMEAGPAHELSRPLLREGIKRVVLGLEEAPKSTNSP